jgi:hypothetical protein
VLDDLPSADSLNRDEHGLAVIEAHTEVRQAAEEGIRSGPVDGGHGMARQRQRAEAVAAWAQG